MPFEHILCLNMRGFRLCEIPKKSFDIFWFQFSFVRVLFAKTAFLRTTSEGHPNNTRTKWCLKGCFERLENYNIQLRFNVEIEVSLEILI